MLTSSFNEYLLFCLRVHMCESLRWEFKFPSDDTCYLVKNIAEKKSSLTRLHQSSHLLTIILIYQYIYTRIYKFFSHVHTHIFRPFRSLRIYTLSCDVISHFSHYTATWPRSRMLQDRRERQTAISVLSLRYCPNNVCRKNVWNKSII